MSLHKHFQQELREEFNRWAQAGRGEEMEHNHVPIVEPTLALMDLRRDDRVIDLGCGSGWLVRRLGTIVPDGLALGIDVSDEMLRRARTASDRFRNIEFLQGSAEQIPTPANSFTSIISVESAYYWHSPARGIAEMLRVLRPGGSAWILINYYRDNPHCYQWNDHYKTAAHLLSADEWQELFRTAGFRDTNHRRIPDLSPTAEVYTGKWFRDAEQMRRHKAEGALLVSGIKP